MENRVAEINIKLIVSSTAIVCLILGFLLALFLSQDTFGYVRFSFFVLSIFVGIPLLIILIVIAAICFDSKKHKVYGFAFLSACIMLPIVFFTSLKILEVTKFAKPGISDYGEMRPIGSELNERIVIAFKEDTSQEESRKFDETILRKTIPQPNGVLLEFADGVCGITYPDTEFKYQIAAVGFCNDATDEQKKKIKEGVSSSKIAFRVFENLRMEEIKTLPLEKKKTATENAANLKTVSNKIAVQTSTSNEVR